MFGKIETRFWDSPHVRQLNDSCKLAFLYLLTNKHGNSLGYYILPPSYMADDLGWSIDRTKRTLATLEEEGFIAYDTKVRIVWIKNYLKYHTLKKHQTERSACDVLANLPRSPLLVGLYEVVGREYPKMEVYSYLESLVTGSLRDGNGIDTNPLQSRAPSISISTSKSISTKERIRSNERIVKKERKRNIKEKERKPEDDLIDYLNQQTNSRFRYSETSRRPFRARLNDHATIDDIRLVIDYLTARWTGDPEMEPYLRPETICRASKFEGYLNAAIKWAENGRPALNKKGQLAKDLAAARRFAEGGKK